MNRIEISRDSACSLDIAPMRLAAADTYKKGSHDDSYLKWSNSTGMDWYVLKIGPELFNWLQSQTPAWAMNFYIEGKTVVFYIEFPNDVDLFAFRMRWAEALSA